MVVQARHIYTLCSFCTGKGPREAHLGDIPWDAAHLVARDQRSQPLRRRWDAVVLSTQDALHAKKQGCAILLTAAINVNGLLICICSWCNLPRWVSRPPAFMGVIQMPLDVMLVLHTRVRSRLTSAHRPQYLHGIVSGAVWPHKVVPEIATPTKGHRPGYRPVQSERYPEAKQNLEAGRGASCGSLRIHPC